MNNKTVWNIIARKLVGESSKKEELELNQWVELDKINSGILRRLIEIWEYNPKRVSVSHEIYTAFRARLNYHNKGRKNNTFFYYALRVAAILFLFISSAALVNSLIPFSGNKEITWQEIFVPRGSRTSILLPDSSKVWISNNSRIRYPDKFDKDTRELDLTGEAYFEVTHNPKKPFIVNMEQNRIKVLGTKFSVSAYPEDNMIRADLLTGKIQLDINTGKNGGIYKSFLVKPSHSLVYDKTSRKITSYFTPDGFFDYWKDGIYTFNNESMESLAFKIARIYNVEIIFENDFIKSKCFSGTISIDDNIFTFMEAIKRTSLESIDYKYENKKIFINLKSN